MDIKLSEGFHRGAKRPEGRKPDRVGIVGNDSVPLEAGIFELSTGIYRSPLLYIDILIY